MESSVKVLIIFRKYNLRRYQFWHKIFTEENYMTTIQAYF